MDPVTARAEFITSKADVVSNVVFDAQVINDQSGFVRGALDLIFVTSAVDDRRLGAILLFEPGPVSGQWVAMAHTGHHTFVLLVAMLRVLVGCNMGKCFDFNCLQHHWISLEHTIILSTRTVGDLLQIEDYDWTGSGGFGIFNDFAIVLPVGALDDKVGIRQIAGEPSSGLVANLRRFGNNVWGLRQTQRGEKYIIYHPH